MTVFQSKDPDNIIGDGHNLHQYFSKDIIERSLELKKGSIIKIIGCPRGVTSINGKASEDYNDKIGIGFMIGPIFNYIFTDFKVQSLHIKSELLNIEKMGRLDKPAALDNETVLVGGQFDPKSYSIDTKLLITKPLKNTVYF